MATTDQLSEEFEGLSDEELIERVRSGNLTQLAADAARRELAARGVDIARAPAPAQPAVSSLRVSVSALTKCIRFLARVLRFPLRAVLGVEPLWSVIVFGPVLLYLLFRLIAYALGPLLMLYPMPGYALPIAYAALTVMALAMVWFGLALWRTAGRVRSKFWRITVRVVAALIAVNTVFATLNLAGVMRHYFSSPPASVMDSPLGR